MIQQKRDNIKKHIYRWLKKSLTFLTILLLTLFAGAPRGSAVSLSGRCPGSSWTCQIGAHGDLDNWNRTVQQRKRFL